MGIMALLDSGPFFRCYYFVCGLGLRGMSGTLNPEASLVLAADYEGAG